MAISLLLCVSPQRNSLSMARVDEVIDGVPSIGWCPVPRKTARSLSWWLSDKKENGDCWRIERRIDQVASSRINLSLCHRESSVSCIGEESGDKH
ncbi:hypothetical protein Bca52824_036548 [Brassica carinata]|uniref:Uncharacterized protein n=1 Tax=Brassica carinata TaxID=52824 RepID=A0A8X7V3U9_BRACI|nr:hypothetical protein Bca52824_036548 [Brassica carinata]